MSTTAGTPTSLDLKIERAQRERDRRLRETRGFEQLARAIEKADPVTLFKKDRIDVVYEAINTIHRLCPSSIPSPHPSSNLQNLSKRPDESAAINKRNVVENRRRVIERERIAALYDTLMNIKKFEKKKLERAEVLEEAALIIRELADRGPSTIPAPFITPESSPATTNPSSVYDSPSPSTSSSKSTSPPCLPSTPLSSLLSSYPNSSILTPPLLPFELNPLFTPIMPVAYPYPSIIGLDDVNPKSVSINEARKRPNEDPHVEERPIKKEIWRPF